MSRARSLFLLAVLAVQCLVVIWLEIRVGRLEREMRQTVGILVNMDTSIKSLANLECKQQIVNHIFHQMINGQRPDCRPLPITQDCRP